MTPTSVTLERFRLAQDGPPPNFATALAELASEGKRSHWIWYILPQLEGLGSSPTARFYALRGPAEAALYLRDETLRPRLAAIVHAIAGGLERGRSLESLLGSRVDAQKAVSSLTLFARIAGDVEGGDEPAGLRRDCAELAAAAEGVLAVAEAQGVPRCAFTLEALRGRGPAAPGAFLRAGRGSTGLHSRAQMRTVRADRYVLPLREGGSVPALVEGDDLGLYVVKLRGAGQGPKALVAELLAGEMARAAGLLVPEIVLVELDRAIAASEPDPELAGPLEASAGTNLGLDYLPGSIGFDPVASPPPDPVTASRVVLFDAFATNVDRTPRNPNILVWHARLWLIDHGAALYFHHGWGPAGPLAGAGDPFPEVGQHVLLRWAAALGEAAEHLGRVLGEELFERVVAAIPASFLEPSGSFPDAASQRAAYVGWLRERARALPKLREEAEHARSLLV